MEDSYTPLFSDSNSADDQITPFDSLDKIIEQSWGGFGCSRLMHVLLLSISFTFIHNKHFLASLRMQSPHGIAQTLLHATQAPTSVLFPRATGLGMVFPTRQLYQHGAWNVLAQSSLACLHHAS
ncbi:hypothetical protein Patl1_19795 [Pistacia atlantica]|uniref:Uncharacterized protein n=1 Tax=Pistacia atlantica TaxID=434234 RepID=A0ACC1BNK7_9ROSI|nr:hypothetical protein Patl1_19795 [Pistacia atlantica]